MYNIDLETPSLEVEGYQLSLQQKRLWQLQQIDNINQPYRVTFTVAIEGNLNLHILKTAVIQVVQQHEILRTNFKSVPGLNFPLQVVNQPNISWNELDLSAWSSQAQAQKIEKTLEQLKHLNFNFEQNSLLHIYLVKLSLDRYIILACLPALCIDSTSVKNLINEIKISYAKCLQGEEINLDTLQYIDIAEWQNQLLETPDKDIADRYWQHQCTSETLQLKLPQEKSSLLTTYQPQVVNIEISSEVLNSISNFTKEYQTSFEDFLLVCWKILLWRLTGSSDLIIATAFSGRKYQELESVIGLLVKYLPLKFSLDKNQTVREIFKQLEEIKANAHQWQEYFTWEHLNVSNENNLELSVLPFGFEFEVSSLQPVNDNLIWTLSNNSAYTDRFKIKLACIEKKDCLQIEFHYDSNLFIYEDIYCLAEQFQALIESIIANSELTISELNILSDRQRHQLLVEFNNTKADYPFDKCMHQLFEEQVARTPDNIAVVYEEQQLTYAELNARANQLAHYLQSKGVGVETLVGICVERSLELLVGIMGILKAGGAYLPVDPSYPQERLEFMLTDSQAPILLTQERLITTLPATTARQVCLDQDWKEIEQHSQETPQCLVNAQNLAYVIYTSGSTGKPKGTLITHQGLVNYLSWCSQAYTVEQGNGSCVHSSIAFDATITGLFAPLLVGNRVHLLAEDLGIEALSAALQTNSHYSLIKITPAQLELLAQQLPAELAAERTKAFVIGGENLTAQHIAFWQQNAPETILINEYGPTETVVGCCIYKVSNGKHTSGSIPIGKAIANTQLYILNESLQPQPIGVLGELYIGGAGVARGYLNRPELTAERFIPNPFICAQSTVTSHQSPRIYKTGDLARFLPDGNIEYLGRIDHQVKIRGFRIELGEIETVLNQHPAIQNNVVISDEDESGDRHLVSYIVLKPKSEIPQPNSSDLRNFLKQKLPDYMVPAVFVMLKTLPLTSNGKVDRKALPAPEQVRPELAATYIAPRNETEQQVAQIWAEVLKLEQVGIYDNFFDLGGHSLLLTQVTSRLYNAFGVEIPLRQMLATPTIAELATIIAQKQLEQVDSELLEQMLAELEELPEEAV